MSATAGSTAAAGIMALFAKYEITDPTQARRLVRERFTSEELATYESALAYLDGQGVIG